MCRIAGIIDRSNKSLRRDILSMRDAMRHGGPDAEGVFLEETAGLAFGHRRLSIIDISDAGNQPMQRDGIILSFNGEIYNYQELCGELKIKGYTFSTHSDTEVIIRAYQCWGLDCFSRFRGMFALAIYDIARSQLVLARDHAGIKPLYYYHQDNKLYFASEIRAFKALSGKWKERDDWQIFFLTYGFLPEPVTTLKGVKPLGKGSCMVFNIHTLSATQHFFYQDQFSARITDLAEAKELIKAKLQQSVNRHLISDAPIGLFLSGGIDSSLLTLLAKPSVPDSLQTLSLVFEDQQFSEESYQQIIIEKTGARHQSFLLNKKHFEESFDDILLAMDQPSTDGINSYFICQYARKAGLKAVLSGLGADELFGGYPSFRLAKHYALLKKIPGLLLELAGFATKDSYRKFSFLQRKDPIGEYLFYRGYYTPHETASLLDMDVKEVKQSLQEIEAPAYVSKLSAGNRASWLESNIYMLGQLLKDTDTMSMWHGLEVRVPFLDPDLLLTVNNISEQLKFDQEQSKGLLIESFKEILPREIWDRKKQGFVLPFANWMKGRQLSPESGPGSIIDTLQKRFDKGKLVWSRYWAYLLVSDEAKISGAGFILAAPNNNGRRNYQVADLKRKKKVLFLCLTTFSQAGGIEKFNRCFLKALEETGRSGDICSWAMSPYDDSSDKIYYSPEKYKGFKGDKFRFIYNAVLKAARVDTVILGHLNLAPVGYLIRQLYPNIKIILITHGIEVWTPLSGLKAKILTIADQVLSVSDFTKQKLVTIHGMPPAKIKIFPNTIDPYFPVPRSFVAHTEIRRQYNITAAAPVIFTLSRLSGREKYKGYDQVIKCLPELKRHFPDIHYIIAGKYDTAEKDRLDSLIQELKLENNVILTGYLAEKSLQEYYQAADLFIMPSRKEGFGIVFLEALICGLPVIAGNKDGSVDALRNGELGTLIDPTDLGEITGGIIEVLSHKEDYTNEYRLMMQQKTMCYFGFPAFKGRLQEILLEYTPEKQIEETEAAVA